MPDDTFAAKRMHAERLIAQGGGMTLDEAREFVHRWQEMSRGPERAVRRVLGVLFVAFAYVAGAMTGLLVGQLVALEMVK
jgi:hypothetical protein